MPIWQGGQYAGGAVQGSGVSATGAWFGVYGVAWCGLAWCAGVSKGVACGITRCDAAWSQRAARLDSRP